jgi:hypothetical protein
MGSRMTTAIGRVLVYLVVLVLLADGIAQLLQPPFMVGAMQGSQVPLALSIALGTITLACTVVLAIPRLAVLGAIVVTGFLGGAIAVHFRLGEIFSPPQLVCLLIGIVMWTGLYLSDARLRALIPVVTPSPGDR